MPESRFVYVMLIKTTPEKLWAALTQREFTEQYWLEAWHDCSWEPGAPWKLTAPDGRVANSGEVLEIDPPRKLVLSWKKELQPVLDDGEHSTCTITLEPQGEAVKLTILHEMNRADSKLIQNVSNGWPRILSSLKSLLETGEALEDTRYWPKAI